MYRITLTIIATLIISGFTYAQDNITTTPAPTKTPSLSTPEATEVSDDEENTGEDLRGIIQYTQADLNVITGNVQRPNGMIWHNAMLYVVCNGDWTIYEINDTTGATRTYIYGVRNGNALYSETSSTGNLTLWVPDSDTNQLLQVNPVRAPQPVTNQVNKPWGIAYLDENHFLVTSITENTISQVSRTGEVVEILAELRSPTGIAIQDNFVYFANNGSARRAIEWFDLDEDTPEAKSLVSGVQNPTNIIMANDEYLYFTYAIGTRGVVGRVRPGDCRDEGCQNSDVEIVLFTELAAPLAGLTISPDMRLFIHTMFRPEIYWLQLPQLDPVNIEENS